LNPTQARQGATAGQKPAATFRADVNLVEVHAVVTDERGAFIENLSKDDFEIYEAGKLQQPTVFQLVDVPIEPVRPAAAGVARVEPDVRATTAQFDGRLYIMVLDDLHTMTLRSPLVRNAARRFVERSLGPNDLAAIVYTSGRTDAAQELTSSRNLLLASVDKFQGQKLPSATTERLAVHLRDRDMERSASDGSTDGSSSSSSSSSPAKTVDDPYDSERGMNARRALETVRDVAQWMANVPGRRKSVVLFSEGIDYDIYDVFNNRSASSVMYDAREAIAAAQRANVSIYAVDPRGLTQLGDEAITVASVADDPAVDFGTTRGFQRELLLAQESLMSLAEETGGLAIVRSNDVAGGLDRIVRDTSRYYVIGYVTDPTQNPGKFRKIEVKVKRPGLRVRARHGYVPPDPKAAAKKREAETKAGTSPALIAALNNPLPIGQVPMRVWAAPFQGTGKNPSVAIAVEVDGSALKYRQQDGRFVEDVEVSIVAADHTGKIRGSDRQTLNLKLKPETHQQLSSRGGVRMLSRIELPPARYQLRIGLHESIGGAVSTVPYDLEVPDYAKTPFALSGLALTSTAAPSMVTPQPDPKFKDVFPVPPIASRVFGRDETLGVFAELYDRSTPAQHDVDLTISIRPADGGPAVFNSTETRTVTTSARTHGYKAQVPLKDVAPGRYVVRVEAASKLGKHSAHREVPIEVATKLTKNTM
jgi:VWFA-related protein